MSAILYDNVNYVREHVSDIIERLQEGSHNIDETEAFIIRAIVESYDPTGLAKSVILKLINNNPNLKENHYLIISNYESNLYSHIRTSMGVNYRDYLDSSEGII